MAKIDDSVKKKVPELRFKGFTDEWEERKFADFIDVKSGKDYKHLNSGSIPVYGTGGYMLSVDRALSDIDAIGIGRKGTIDKPYLLKAPFWTVDTLFYAVPKQNIDLQFSLSIFKKINWKKFDESTGVPSLSKTVINSVSVSVPSYEEQQKIGSFFKQLDDTIALHQRKLDLLKEQKKGFLQKMFPKNGAKVPELRFAGFADAWEERKFGTLYKNNNEKNKGQFGSESTISIASMKFKAEGNGASVDSIDGYKVLRVGDIAYEGHKNKQFSFGRFVLNDIGDGIMSPRFTTLRPLNIMDINFWKQYIIYEPIMKHLLVKSTKLGTMMNELVQDDLFKLTLLVPSDDEQQKIGSFFKQLDDTIALHQRKLDLLKEQKKGYLQKMFV